MTMTDERVGTARGEARRQNENPGEMSFFEHLAELRNRVLISGGAVFVLAIAMWFAYDTILRFMEQPYCSFLHRHAAKSFAGCRLVTTSPLEGVTTRLKICGYGGIALATPVWAWQLWQFIAPGLYRHERRYVVPFVGAAVALFSMGVTMAILVFPKALQWLIDVSGSGVVPLFSPSNYFSLYALMCVIFGLVFTYPLVVVFLEITSAVPSAKWRKWRRTAIIVICAVAAVITPSSDPFSFTAMAVPMLVFYEGAILVGRLLHK